MEPRNKSQRPIVASRKNTEGCVNCGAKYGGELRRPSGRLYELWRLLWQRAHWSHPAPSMSRGCGWLADRNDRSLGVRHFSLGSCRSRGLHFNGKTIVCRACVNDEKRSRLSAALRAQRCLGGKMRCDDGKFEIDVTVSSNANRYDVEVDTSLRLIKKTLED